MGNTHRSQRCITKFTGPSLRAWRGEGGRDSKVCFLRQELCDKVKKGKEKRVVEKWTAIKYKHSRIKTHPENLNLSEKRRRRRNLLEMELNWHFAATFQPMVTKRATTMPTLFDFMLGAGNQFCRPAARAAPPTNRRSVRWPLYE